MAKKFFYVCAGVLLLALSYHFGASDASAQFGANVSGSMTISDNSVLVMTPNGDVYSRQFSWNNGLEGELRSCGNFWSGSPTAARSQTWGSVKAQTR